MTPDPRGLEFLGSAMPIASASVDRLDQIPARLSPLFHFNAEEALADDRVRAEMAVDASQLVVRALAEELAKAPRLDRDRFRSVAGEIKRRTGQKGKQLFHPIRVALTGLVEGPELDLIVPAIDRGATLPSSAGIPRILGNRERAAAFVHALDALVG
jgi:nondiscriminating glutamyl-tRNA synthetase